MWALAGDTGAGTAWTLPSGQVNGKTVAAAAAGPIVDAAVELRLHNCTPNHHFEVRLKRRTSDELLWSPTSRHDTECVKGGRSRMQRQTR